MIIVNLFVYVCTLSWQLRVCVCVCVCMCHEMPQDIIVTIYCNYETSEIITKLCVVKV